MMAYPKNVVVESNRPLSKDIYQIITMNVIINQFIWVVREAIILRQGSFKKCLFFTILLILIISIIPPNSVAQEEILSEIGEDWPTDVILIYIETPNKFDRTYGTNITDNVVLNEISSIEEALDPQKEDEGNSDDVFYILSISSLIKEMNVAPKNIMNAVVHELDPVTDPGEPPGDHEYAIPEDQYEIDSILSDIPTDIRDLFVRDTNDDGIWDTAVIWVGVSEYSQSVLEDINELIDRYYIDPDASDSDFNSQNSWWNRIETGVIHCSMTNLGYVESYEDYHGPQNSIGLALAVTILFILVGLLSLSTIMINKQMKKSNNQKIMKKKMMTVFIVFIVLIIASISMALFKTSATSNPQLDHFSAEYDGGEMGLILIYGSPAPSDDNPSKGSGSMKDIDVLKSIERLEVDLNNLRDEDGRRLINPPLNIVDIMKTIQVTFDMVNTEPFDSLPVVYQFRVKAMANTSFWDAIFIAGEIDSVHWFQRYGKSLQDSLIDIFYGTITLEIWSTFVNEDYSKSLIYLQIPVGGQGETDLLKSEINGVIRLHQPFISSSNVASVKSGAFDSQNIAFGVKIMLLFLVLAVGIIFFVLTILQIRKLDKKEDQNQGTFQRDGEAIFEDITDEPVFEDITDKEYYPPQYNNYRPPQNPKF